MEQKYTYKDFTYILDKNNNHIVEVNPKRDTPEEIYKYYSITKNSITALKDLKLYATHPFLFNDSIDSSELILDFRNISKERYISFYERIINREEFLKHDFGSLYEEDKKRKFYDIRNAIYTTFSRNFGIISLTTIPFNILMWSHYTNETGFVIEFDTKKLLDSIKINKDVNNYCFRPVQYVENIEFIDVFSKDFSTPDVSFLYATTIKRNEWEYENEWRLSIYKNDMGIPFSNLYPDTNDYEGSDNRFFHYSLDSIHSISLGKHFFNGKNCEFVNEGNIFTLYRRDDEKNKENDELFIELVNHLAENFNDNLYMSGEYENGNTLVRSLGKINLEKVSENVFKLIDLKQIVLQD
ncbi:DUF2971 domain-containing protein [Chryseobacterium lathyri]|uniref:DUF2971 domain-containing protein n=1 Tax=Chryseobacterium lathyri TaxID=395933 RepID=UPI0027865DC1|nr:DUF2971 domain-containing protein [Chryseobacterium lathyri]MDQ0065917.1 hypothetical protein [Chryseobacterium lathyri]